MGPSNLSSSNSGSDRSKTLYKGMEILELDGKTFEIKLRRFSDDNFNKILNGEYGSGTDWYDGLPGTMGG